MPVPTTFADIDANPNNNSPQGNETLGPYANDYLQAAFALIKQIYEGALEPTAAVDFNAQKLSNLANGTANTDAATLAQVKAVYKVGEVKMWHGAVANIATTWGAGWQLADGTNGTADLRDKFVVGAGSTYAAGATGGTATNVLSQANLPAHSHPFSATTGGQSNPHSHAASDSGHDHAFGLATGSDHYTTYGAGAIYTTAAPYSYVNGMTASRIGTGYANISVGNNNADHNHAVSGTTSSIGSGSAVENRPPYYALCFIEFTGIGA